jgi:hypothetical protein
MTVDRASRCFPDGPRALKLLTGIPVGTNGKQAKRKTTRRTGRTKRTSKVRRRR